jgi:phenylpropionate dioxygenase-like ring-hydroxylating dioxygenase large terminal subunit
MALIDKRHLNLCVTALDYWTDLKIAQYNFFMGYDFKISKFGRKDFVPTGWYWLLSSEKLKIGKALPAKFLNEELVVYRGEDNQVRAFSAYCPHMGAHLCDGKVEGSSIRCPFHNWKFADDGHCEDIPVQKETRMVQPLKKFFVTEKYNLIWFWYGESLPTAEVPVVPELKGFDLDSELGKPFTKECHPNVMMINAIDAHHFKSVHRLIVNLEMEPKVLSDKCIQFSNTTPMPTKNIFLRWASQFYKKALTYELTYWWGHTGSVMVGPDFLHFYIIFALRPNLDGKAEGQTILVTKHRAGFFGSIANSIILFLTKLVGNYFAKGDTVIFSRIKFNFQTPVRADRAILHFIDHYEKLDSPRMENKCDLNEAIMN